MKKHFDNISPFPVCRQEASADKADLPSLDLLVAWCTTSDERSCIQSQSVPATVNEHLCLPP